MLAPYFQLDLAEAGCDEAGRGCLAGPVFAAAVVFPPDIKIKGLDDSKKLTESHRLELREEIKSRALHYAVASVDHQKIDQINILNASILAMHHAIDQLNFIPGYIIIDGNRFHPYKEIPFKTIVKGDGKFQSIAAASILAKSYRDDYMVELHKKHPQYGWDQNKGYPTKAHRIAIKLHGSSTHHRTSFNLLGNNRQTSLLL